MKDLRRLAYEFELDQSHCKWVAIETQVERKSKTRVDVGQLASPFGQGFKEKGLWRYDEIVRT